MIIYKNSLTYNLNCHKKIVKFTLPNKETKTVVYEFSQKSTDDGA
jgi:hypothetical protein